MSDKSRIRKYWVGSNWKCNGSIASIKDSVTNMVNDLDYNQSHIGKFDPFNTLDFMVLPGMLHLPIVQAILKDNISIGAQNVSATGEGAFTGEVSADHLSDYRINTVLIGHHERR